MFQSPGNSSAGRLSATAPVKPGLSTGSSPAPGPSASHEEPEAKKKTKKKQSKEFRRRRREEETLKGIYGPKDSHIHMITPAVMQQIQSDRARESLYKSSAQSSAAKDFKDVPGPSSQFTPAGGSPSWLSPGSVWGSGQKSSPVSLQTEFPGLGETPKRYAQGANAKDIVEERVGRRSVGVQTPDEAIQSPVDVPLESHLDTPSNVLIPLFALSPQPLIDPVPSVSNKKPSKKPMVVNLEDLIQTKTSNKLTRKLQTLRPIKTSLSSVKETTSKKGMQRAGNILDSSGLVLMHRGKLRETPKSKKPSKLKLSILRTRSVRRTNLGKLTEASTEADVREDVLVLKELEDSIVLENQNDILESVNETCSVRRINIGKLCANTEASSEELEEKEGVLVLKELEDSPVSKKLDEIPESFNAAEDSLLEVRVSEHDSIVPSKQIAESNIIGNEAKKWEASSQSFKLEPTLVKEPVIDETSIFRRLMDDAERKPEEPIELPQTPVPCTPPEVIGCIKTQIHSRKFRSYCDMKPSKELHGHVIALMNELHRFQDRLYHTDPIKYKTKKKYVHGIKDVASFLGLGKLIMVILAPDIEPNDGKGGLDDKISNLIQEAKEKHVPYIFSGHRYILGKPLKVKGPVSVIGIWDKQGAEELFNKVLEESEKLRDIYTKDFESKLSNYMKSTSIPSTV